MAKQNFLSGGYYGKLGMTVGQRWKNIRTIRSYVIPHNPRTEAQQANRGQFGDCVFYAQIGMQLNYKAPCFNATDKTSWNYRMSTARGLQDLGLTELERFPLYPLNFSVPYQITGANVTEVVDETHIKVAVVGNLPEAERVLTMLLLLPGTTDWKNRLAVCIGQNSSEDYSTFTFQLPEDLTLDNGMQCRFISCDDTDSTTDLIASSQIELSYIPIDEHEFDTTFVSLARSGNTYTLTLNEPYQNGTNTVTINRLMAVSNGILGQVTPPEATLINNGGKFAVSFTCSETENQNLWAFPSGCAIQFSEIKSISSTVHATATNKTIAISNSDLSRTYDNRIASVSRSGADFTLTYATEAPTSTSGSGNITLHAVSNGAFIDFTPPTYHATKTNITFTQSYTNEEEILAFPSGSTALASLTRIGNGVTYTPYYTSGNSVVNTSDLTRNITSQPTKTATSQIPVFTFTLDGNFTSKTQTSNCTGKDNRFITSSSFSRSGTWTASGQTISYQWSESNKIPCRNGSFITVANPFTAVANGVSYIASINNFAFTNIAICSYNPVTYGAEDVNVMGNGLLSLNFTIANAEDDYEYIEELTATLGSGLSFVAADYEPSFTPNGNSQIQVVDNTQTLIEFFGTSDSGGAEDSYVTSLSTNNGTITLSDTNGNQWQFTAIDEWEITIEP